MGREKKDNAVKKKQFRTQVMGLVKEGTADALMQAALLMERDGQQVLGGGVPTFATSTLDYIFTRMPVFEDDIWARKEALSQLVGTLGRMVGDRTVISHKGFLGAANPSFPTLVPALLQRPPSVKTLRTALQVGRPDYVIEAVRRHPERAVSFDANCVIYYEAMRSGHRDVCAALEQAWDHVGMNHPNAIKIYDECARRNDFRDVATDHRQRFILPALVNYLSGGAADADRLREWDERTCSRLSSHMRMPAFAQQRIMQQGAFGTRLREAIALSRNWHHPNMRFPDLAYSAPEGFAMPEGGMNRAWHPLLQEPFLHGGLVLRSVTNAQGLDKIHRQLGHCVDTYTQACCDAKSHIVSVETPDGRARSTVEIGFFPSRRAPSQVPYPEVALPGKGLTMVVKQHEARKNVYPRVGAEHDAVKALMKAFERGDLRVPEALGETEESRHTHAHFPYVMQASGYYPSWDNLDRVLQEYKKDMYRGAEGEDAGGRLVYASPAIHLVEGVVPGASGKMQQLRHMGAKEYIRASGLLEQFDACARREYPERAAAMKAAFLRGMGPEPVEDLPPPMTPEQKAHAYNAGTLPRNEVMRLSPDEARSYADRLAQQPKAAAGFGRFAMPSGPMRR